MLQFEHLVWMTDEPTRLMHIDVFALGETRMDKSGGDVTLCRAEIQLSGQHHHCANRGPLAHWSTCLKELYALPLAMASSIELCFEL